MTDALRLHEVKYHFTTDWARKKVQVLNNVSLTVHRGESFGFLGHNGAGKTTTIKAILGLIQVRHGTIEIFGNDHHSPHARREVGYLPEQPYFYDHLTVRELLELYACLAGVPRSQRSDEVSRVLSCVQLTSRTKSRMRTLSKGLTQRVALAQAMLNSPKLLILDEPFSGLDPVGRREFRDIFAELKRNGTTIFVSSHILSDVEFLCDRASIMVKGEIKGIYDLRTPPPELCKTYYQLVLRADPTFTVRCPTPPDSVVAEDRFLRLQFAQREAAESALRSALSLDLEIQSFELVHRSLEDVFMDITRREGAISAG